MQAFLKELFRSQDYDDKNFFLIAGPCVVESAELLDIVASKVSSLCIKMGIPYIFKASYRKANRTSGGSFTGIGDEQALSLVQKKPARNINCPPHPIYMHMMKRLQLQFLLTCYKSLPFCADKQIC